MSTLTDCFHITPHLLITRNEAEIVDILADHNEMPKDFEENHVRSFFVGKDFHLVLYFPQQQDRGFQMFVVRDFSVHVDELYILRDLFSQLIQQKQNVPMMKKAHYRVDHMIHMARTFRALMHHEEPLSNDDFLPGTFSAR